MKHIFSVFVNDILGLTKDQEDNVNNVINDVMDLVLTLRKKAKSNKDFDTADLIRNELQKLNITINDTREGSNWNFND